MLGTLILGALAGFVAPYAEDPLRGLLKTAMMADQPIDAAEMRGLALALCLLVAAILGNALSGGGAIALTIGAVIGVFGPRVLARIQNR